jgi:hypothetical protein
MNTKLLLAGLLVALMAPAAQAAGLHLRGGPPFNELNVPPAITFLRVHGQPVAHSRGRLISNPQPWNGQQQGIWTRSEFGSQNCGPEGGYYNGNGNGPPPGVPEPEGIAGALAAAVLGLGFAGYNFGQRRRVHGAAQVQ